MRKTSDRMFLSQFIRKEVYKNVNFSHHELDQFDNLFYPIIEGALNDCDSNILLSLDGNGAVCEKESILLYLAFSSSGRTPVNNCLSDLSLPIKENAVRTTLKSNRERMFDSYKRRLCYVLESKGEIMESVWVLVGEGANDLRIPCMFFKSEKDGRDYLKDKLSLESESNTFDLDDICNDISNEPRNMYEHEDDEYDEDEALEDKLTGTVFTGAYFGCGGCWGLTLEERKFGEIFINWDLD